MGASNEHQQKWLHNRSFMVSIFDRETHADWLLVSAFYVAVHAVEALFAEHSIHSTDHHERKRILRREPRWKAIYDNYHPLENASWAARYECNYTESADFVRANFLKGYLLKLEQAVCRQLKQTKPTLDPLPSKSKAPPQSPPA